MKRFLLPSLTILIFILFCGTTKAQVTGITMFYESFDSVITKWQMTRTSPSSFPGDNFFQDTQVTRGGTIGSASDTVARNPPSPSTVETVSYLTTPNLLDTFQSVTVSFDQICYIGAFNAAAIQVSFNNGPWKRIPVDSLYEGIRAQYTGSNNVNQNPFNNSFNKLSRQPEWGGISDFGLVFPVQQNDLDWRNESFDISLMKAVRGIPSGFGNDSVRFRLELRNNRSSPPAREGNHQWWVDNFTVTGANCGESTAPRIELDEFNDPTNPSRNRAELTGIVYQEAPYFFDGRITDNASSIDTAYVVYYVETFDNSVSPPARVLKGRDTVPMIFQGANRYSGQINKLSPKGFTIEIGDFVFWKVVAIDGSACQNVAEVPGDDQYREFNVRRNAPRGLCDEVQVESNFPYVQDFEDQLFNPNPGVFRNVEGWRNVGADFHDWLVGEDSSGKAGEYGITESFPLGGKYLYYESEDDKNDGTPTYKDSTAFVTTPCFDLYGPDIQNGLVRFYLNMNTFGNEDTVFVDIYDQTPVLPLFPDGRFVRNAIPPVSGGKGDNWLPFEFSTFKYRNSITQIRFVGRAGRDDGLSNMGLDSFKIVPAALEDMRLNQISINPFNPIGTKDTIKLQVQNLGVFPVSNLDFTYEVYQTVNGVETRLDSLTVENWNKAIIFPSTDTIISLNDNFSELYDVPKGDYTIKAWLSYVNDEVKTNDTSFINPKGVFYASTANYTPSFRFADNFDEDTLFEIANITDPFQNKWELGTPDYDNTYSSFSKPNCWDINLNQPYTGRGREVLLTSPLFDTRQANQLILSFLNNRDMLKNRDGVFIEYSLNRGLTWDTLPGLSDPKRLRWYNSRLSEGGLGARPVFSGTTHEFPFHWDGYVETEVKLPPELLGEKYVLFRYGFFAADLDGGNDGMSIDNFLIYDPSALDAEPQHMLSPTTKCELSDNQPIEFVLKNRGLGTITSIDVKYRVTYLPTGVMQEATETFNRTVAHRDTLMLKSTPTFDMFVDGDYMVDIITLLTGDNVTENDTLSTLVEKVDGCSLQFLLETSGPARFGTSTQSPPDSTVYEFKYTSGDRNYRISQSYIDSFPNNFANSPDLALAPNQVIRNLLICIKDGSQVEFNLNDRDTLIKSYSMIAFNGREDTILFQGVTGGPDAPTRYFNWNCPPQRSAGATSIILDQGLVQLPVAKDYQMDVRVRNFGLDSLDNVDIHLEVDGQETVKNNVQLVPPLITTANGLQYTDDFVYRGFDPVYLAPGAHNLRAWTSLPNRQTDLRFSEDTTERFFAVIDTIPDVNDSTFGVVFGEFCEDFEDVNSSIWVAMEPDRFLQGLGSFEQGTPNQTTINTAFSGSSAWMTNIDSDYPDLDQTSVISPFVELLTDSCYEISFNHNYFITDDKNDGGTFQIGNDKSFQNTWIDENIIWNKVGVYDANDPRPDQVNWFNRSTINGMPDNTLNSGWSGNSAGWIESKVTAFTVEDDGFYLFRWRFSSDNAGNGEGWAIDDFCLKTTDVTNCYAVGLDEENFDLEKLSLGQNIPNPAGNSTQINYYLPTNGSVQFIVLNMMGQLMFESNASQPKGNSVWELNTSNYAEGVYYYSVIFEGQRLTKKMIITK